MWLRASQGQEPHFMAEWEPENIFNCNFLKDRQIIQVCLKSKTNDCILMWVWLLKGEYLCRIRKKTVH